MSRLMVVLLAIFVLLVYGYTAAVGDDSDKPLCTTVFGDFGSCDTYLDQYSFPDEDCCKAMGELAYYSNDDQTRAGVCQCIKDETIVEGGIDVFTVFYGVAETCGTSLNLPVITATTNCSE
ncbi:hypothetical protein HS088_TW16G00774 [Tripterygium wilfordii]|uniref:Bifunctional inhibitor/plant lipid transfer protein/seed storage helical domain-containing protein n=2 Tax=Tripterygium wilfordii TaxID=458696 RepID=A0A7J7CJT7_TRIWF|nr:hypothetical protein HS088_TW16G00774 [Tripterygium wilfordii]